MPTAAIKIFAADLFSAESLATFVRIVAGLGVVAALGAEYRHVRSRRRWRAFKDAVLEWLSSSTMSVIEHPKLMSDEEWDALCEILLTNSGFTPFETQQVLKLAVTTARGLVGSHVL